MIQVSAPFDRKVVMSDNISFVLQGIELVSYVQRPIPESVALLHFVAVCRHSETGDHTQFVMIKSSSK